MARWEFRIKILMVFCSFGISAQILPSSLDFGMSRRPGTTCTFNPCTISNFCGSGRTCEIDDNCISRCNCLDDSVHPECTSKIKDEQTLGENGLTKDSTKPSNNLNDSFESNVQSKFDDDPVTVNTSQCNFDPCKTMAWICDGGRRCVTRDCILHCECTSESTHTSCISDRPSETNDANNCGGFSGMRCIHGDCVRIEDAWSCQCHEDWRGAICDQHVSTGCTRACDYGYECSWYMNTLQICKPKQITTTTIHNTMIENSTSLSLTLNPCLEGYVFHPISKRNCSSGLLCEYGVCEDVENGSSVCLCDQGALGPTCNLTCCKDCGIGGECVITEDEGQEMCRCHPYYTGIDCNLSTNTGTVIPWYTWLIVTCSIVLVLLLILLVVIPYVLWKRRVIPIMKIVYHFQGFEDDDGRDWDVCIYSPPEGHTFVSQILGPKCEDELGLKTIIHYQNVTSNNSIPDEVLQTLKNTRRIILVITPDYKPLNTVSRHNGPPNPLKDVLLSYKNRIIPILLESFSGSANSLPKKAPHIKISNPLIWPGLDSEEHLLRFWNRLELCLPKNRDRLQHPRADRQHHPNGNVPKHCSMGDKKNHHQNGHSVAHIHTEYETDHYHKINGVSRL